jgi:hypothetical protein
MNGETIQKDFFECLGLPEEDELIGDPTTETSSVHCDPESPCFMRALNNYLRRQDTHEESMREAFRRMQPELFPEDSLQKQFERIAPSRILGVGGISENSAYPDESTLESFIRSSRQFASVFAELDFDETSHSKSRSHQPDTMSPLNTRLEDDEASGEYDDWGHSRL